MCVTGEKHDTAAVRAEAAEKPKNQGRMSDMDHLKALFVSICCSLDSTNKVPVIGIADKTGEWWKATICDLLGDVVCEFLYGRVVCEIKLIDVDVGFEVFRNCRTKFLCIDVAVHDVANSQDGSVSRVLCQKVLDSRNGQRAVGGCDDDGARHSLI